LIALIESENASYREKNRAIWALGQIGDRRALPLLQRLDTDEIQEKPYNPDQYIVQYSVEKAIRQINGSFSLTRWMYRWL
jgi:HEAT repeat protein